MTGPDPTMASAVQVARQRVATALLALFCVDGASGCTSPKRHVVRLPSNRVCAGLSTTPIVLEGPSTVAHAAARVLTTRDPEGFQFLASTRVRVDQLRNKPEAAVLERADELCWLAAEFDVSGQPTVDFTTHLVLVLASHESTGELPEPTRLTLDEHDILQAHLAHPYAVSAQADTRHGIVRVLALSRTAIPVRGFRYRLQDGRLLEFRLRHPEGRRRPPDLDEEKEPTFNGDCLERAEMPKPGDAHLERLKNGTFVWVVRHFSGEVTVLDARGTCDAYSKLPGIPRIVRWERAVRRFEFIFDEYGVARHCPNLPHYEVRVDEANGNVCVGAQSHAFARKLPEPLLDDTIETSDRNTAISRFQPLRIESALRSAPGEHVLVDASLVVSPTDTPKICDTRHTTACLDLSACPAKTRQVRSREKTAIGGPLVLQVLQGALCDPILTRHP